MATAKSAGGSFLDILLGALPGVVQAAAGSGSRAQSHTNSESGDRDAKKSDATSSTQTVAETPQSSVPVTVPVQPSVETNVAPIVLIASSHGQAQSGNQDIETASVSGAADSVLSLTRSNKAEAPAQSLAGGVTAGVTAQGATSSQKAINSLPASIQTAPELSELSVQSGAPQKVDDTNSALPSESAANAALASSDPVVSGQTVTPANAASTHVGQQSAAVTSSGSGSDAVASATPSINVPSGGHSASTNTAVVAPMITLASAAQAIVPDVAQTVTPATPDAATQSAIKSLQVAIAPKQFGGQTTPVVRGNPSLPTIAPGQTLVKQATSTAASPALASGAGDTSKAVNDAHHAAATPSDASANQGDQAAQKSASVTQPERQVTPAGAKAEPSNPLLNSSQQGAQPIAQAVQSSTVAVALAAAATLTLPAASTQSQVPAPVAPLNGVSGGQIFADTCYGWDDDGYRREPACCHDHSEWEEQQR